MLESKGAKVIYNDPYVPDIKTENEVQISVPVNNENLAAMDCVVIAVDHSSYDLSAIVNESKLTFDTRGCTKGLNNVNLVRLGE